MYRFHLSLQSIIDKRSSKDKHSVIHEEHIEENVTEYEPECEPKTRKFMLSGIKVFRLRIYL